MSVKRLTLVDTTRLAMGAETAVVLEADLNALEAQVRDLTDKLAAAEAERRELKEIILDLGRRCERAEAALAVAREALREIELHSKDTRFWLCDC